MVTLTIQGLSVTYGGLRAVNDVNLRVPAGQLIGLIGPNGAGKTTCIDAMSGFTPCKGSIKLGDAELRGVPAYRRARLGVSRTFQSGELFVDLSVRENLFVAAERPRWWDVMADLVRPPTKVNTDQITEAVELLGLAPFLSDAPEALSLGQQKLVSVGRALASNPQFLLLDEPAAGLNSDATRKLATLLRRIVDRGIGTLLVDHDMGLVLTACDYIYVLEFGKLIAEGTPTQIRSDPNVVQAYLGKQELPEDIAKDAAELVNTRTAEGLG
jgi:branched-chain amino acid transport system ATP-binding protein